MRIYNLLVHGALYERDPRAPAASCRSSRACSIAGCLVSSLSSIAIDPGETRAADPRRRPAHPAPEAARPDRLQHDVGAHRLHRGERRHAHHPGLAPARSLARLRRALRQRSPPRCRAAACSSGTAASGTAAARTAPTQRRVGIAMNYCAGLDPPAGEPAARHPARDRARLLAAAARAGRLRRLPRAHRPHRQARPEVPARRRFPRRRDDLGSVLRKGLTPGRRQAVSAQNW